MGRLEEDEALVERWPARRINVRVHDGEQNFTLGFSIPAGVDDERALQGLMEMQRAAASGRSRRIVSIDGPPDELRDRLTWAVKVILAYASSCAVMVWAATFGRPARQRRLAVIEGSARVALRAVSDHREGGEPPPPRKRRRMSGGSAFPILKTARDLVAEGVLPCGEDYVRQLAREHGVGRKLGRTYVFTPADVEALIASLPCPSKSPAATVHPTSTSAGPSAESALTRALELATRPRPKTSASGAKRNSLKGRSTVTPFRAPSAKRL